jgi:hypothetical protein
VGDDVPPQVGRRGIAVEKDDRVTLARIDIGHLTIENLDAFPCVRIGSADGVVHELLLVRIAVGGRNLRGHYIEIGMVRGRAAGSPA